MPWLNTFAPSCCNLFGCCPISARVKSEGSGPNTEKTLRGCEPVALTPNWGVMYHLGELLPEFMDFMLFGKTMLVVNKKSFGWPINAGSEVMFDNGLNGIAFLLSLS